MNYVDDAVDVRTRSVISRNSRDRHCSWSGGGRGCYYARQEGCAHDPKNLYPYKTRLPTKDALAHVTTAWKVQTMLTDLPISGLGAASNLERAGHRALKECSAEKQRAHWASVHTL